MLTEQLLRCMPNDQLVMALRAETNSITSTPAELVLLERFEALLDEMNSDLVAAAADYELDAKHIKTLGDALIQSADNTAELLKTIGEAGIDSSKELKAELDLAQKFRALTEDAGDVFTRLSQLTTTAQE